MALQAGGSTAVTLTCSGDEAVFTLPPSQPGCPMAVRRLCRRRGRPHPESSSASAPWARPEFSSDATASHPPRPLELDGPLLCPRLLIPPCRLCPRVNTRSCCLHAAPGQGAPLQGRQPQQRGALAFSVWGAPVPGARLAAGRGTRPAARAPWCGRPHQTRIGD